MNLIPITMFSSAWERGATRRLAYFVLLLAVAGPPNITMAQTPTRPNIVLILADDLGWSDLGCYGHPYHRTPNIDGLAAEGLRFTNGYAPAPICSASRASILTGKTTARLGFEFVTKNAPGTQQLDSRVPLQSPAFTLNLPTSELTVAEELQSLGYQTAFFGKWHVCQHYERRYLAWHPDFGPKQQGFNFAIEDFGDHPYAWGKRKQTDAPNGVIPLDSMVSHVTDFILDDHVAPYFLMMGSFHVHTPVKNRCRWLVEQYESRIPVDARNRRQRLEYAAFVETLDHHVGRVLRAVEESGKKSETLVVFLSDNGGHPEYCSNAPLRGSKWNLYEGGIRVPFLARWPKRIAAGATSQTPVVGYDLLPTFVELAGGKAENVDGSSVVSIMDDPQHQLDRNLVWHFPYYHPESTFSVALDNIGVDDFAISKTRPQSALRRGRYKILEFAEDDRVELYDLQSDIAEQHDLSGEQPEVAKEMAQRLTQELNRMHARRAVPTSN